MRDTLYYNVFSFLPDTTLTCEIPHYTHQQSIYGKTEITAKITKQYSSPLTPGFFLDVTVVKSSDQSRIEDDSNITIQSTTISKVDNQTIEQFAKKNKFTVDGESTTAKVGQGRPKNALFDLDDLSNIIFDEDDTLF